jgi:hypothetical protein
VFGGVSSCWTGEISPPLTSMWAVLIPSPRNYSLERGEGTNATQDLGSPRYLPKDGSFSDYNVLLKMNVSI